MRERFEDWSPTAKTRAMLDECNRIIGAYQAQGYDLSLRQLYYQLVSRDILPNRQKEYKRLVNIVGRGRLAGIIDWAAIDDRVRSTETVSTWESPASILRSAARSFALDLWEPQPWHVEVMVEKDALSGVLGPVCRRERVNFTANRGYSSLSHLYRIGKRLASKHRQGKQILIIYFGDHDPSGLDMDRDLEERLGQFSYWADIRLDRAALLYSQVEQYSPPPNPAKLTDTRADGYIAEFGFSSWELDALEPSILADLVTNAISDVRDEELWDELEEEENQHIERLEHLAATWD